MEEIATGPREREVVYRRRSRAPWVLALLGIAVLLGIGALWAAGGYNGLVRSDQAVRAQWAQVENAYQRRSDLIPNLVQTVKGAAAFEQETFTQVAEARASVGQLSAQATRDVLENPEAFARLQQAQDGLSSALSRLMVVAERYPELKATQNFRDLQAQLEGSENRIAVERMRFNEAARDFNIRRNRFPTVFLANMFGQRFAEKPYFQARAGAEVPPPVRF